jgi:nitronate monooxygenase
MTLPAPLVGRLRLPLVAAPMFLVSGPALVIAACKAGVLGTFPALNQRTSEGFSAWLEEIEAALSPADAPYGVNLIVHKTNPRLGADLDICVRHKVPLIITSLGAVKDLVAAVHSYGGLVFHDVTNMKHAEKAIEAGVDGVIPVCAGAGGHAGTLSPFALVQELRAAFPGTSITLSGAITNGRHVAAALAMGADLAYMGTRFIATAESQAQAGYKAMLLDADAADIVYTPKISGIPANFLLPSLIANGLDPATMEPKTHVDMGEELDEAKAWKTIWSAGQGVGGITDSPSTAELVNRLEAEYRGALAEAAARFAHYR